MSFNPKIKLADWQGKSVWLIGASSGIGEALARKLSSLDAQVILSARSADRLAELSRELPRSSPLAMDFTEGEALKAMWRQACEASVPSSMPDVVIVNAGSYEPMLAQDFDLTRAKQQFEVNVGGPLNVLAQVLPAYIAAKRGHVVLVSSVAGYRALPKALVYGASKSALSYMAETLYVELANKGVAVTLVCPGFVETPLTADNDFEMPVLISAEEAAEHIVHGLAKGEFEIHFPKRFTRFLKVLGWLPRSLYFKLVRKLL
jgi:short-subunit dehydrogenase